MRGGPRVRDDLPHYGSTRRRWDAPHDAGCGVDAALVDELLSTEAKMHWCTVEIRFREPKALNFAVPPPLSPACFESLPRVHGPAQDVRCLERTPNPCDLT